VYSKLVRVTRVTIGLNGEKADDLGDTKKIILNLLLEGSKTAGEIADKLEIQKEYN
jgi:predicted ArsR family transcriptional regulator